MSAALANPYVGPRPFSAAEAGHFFGREQEANQEYFSVFVALTGEYTHLCGTKMTF
ncbi:MAG: hypothetical protein HYR94_20875 [Chloroflexi bacterium]|nr:hypothetical protein [Chloroflexota bacterium]